MKETSSGSQTVGPYFLIGLQYLCGDSVLPNDPIKSIEVRGRLLDGRGAPIPDAFLEIWQADSQGTYLTESWHPDNFGPRDFPGFCRVSTDHDGQFHFITTKPGAVPYDEQRMQAPHLVVLVFMRGLLRNLVTRMYFPNEAANAADPILQLIPAVRRSTLIAKKIEDGSGLEWTIIMRGDAETVFFDW